MLLSGPFFEPTATLHRRHKKRNPNKRRTRYTLVEIALAERRGIRTEALPWRQGTLHDLRDTFITGVKGLPLDVLKRVAGHANVSTTLRYYTAETDRDADDVRAALVNSGLARPRIAVG